MSTTWLISIDWDRNGDHTGTYDDVTSRVLQTNWFLGMRKPYQEMADNSVCVFVLRYRKPTRSGFNNVIPLSTMRIECVAGAANRSNAGQHYVAHLV